MECCKTSSSKPGKKRCKNKKVGFECHLRIWLQQVVKTLLEKKSANLNTTKFFPILLIELPFTTKSLDYLETRYLVFRSVE